MLERLVAEAGAEPRVAAIALTHGVRAAHRKGVDLEYVDAQRWIDLFKALGQKKFGREAIPVLLQAFAGDKDLSVEGAIERTGVGSLSDEALDGLINQVIVQHADEPMHNPTEANRIKRLMGLVMTRVKGRRDGREIHDRLEEQWRVRVSGRSTSTSC
jgi:Glu-tRNA(Gln) amidotransferase subunit E-like FAD-binding protein